MEGGSRIWRYSLAEGQATLGVQRLLRNIGLLEIKTETRNKIRGFFFFNHFGVVNLFGRLKKPVSSFSKSYF